MNVEKLYEDLYHLRDVAENVLRLLRGEPGDIYSIRTMPEAIQALHDAVYPDVDNDTAQDMLYRLAAGIDKPEDYWGSEEGQ